MNARNAVQLIGDALDRAEQRGANAGSIAAARRILLTSSIGTPVAGPRTMRAWMQAHDGMTIDTIQVAPHMVWAPLNRVVDSSRASYVQLDGSRRDYAGMRVVTMTDDGLIVTDDDGTAIAYALSQG